MEVRWSLCDSDTVEVIFESGAEPEYYSVKEFAAIYGEDALPERNDPQELDAELYSEYWAAALRLVNAWAKYQGKRKLYANYVCEDTRRRVEHVVIRNYGGDISKLLRHEHGLAVVLNYALADFRYQCRKYKVEPVNIVWLGLHLQEDRHYKSLRGKCQRRRDKNKPPTPLNELL